MRDCHANVSLSHVLACFAIAALLFFAPSAPAQSNSIFGNWENPTGSVIEVYPCGSDACLRIIAISSHAPTRFDAKNPNSSLRTRPLCKLQIGSGFHLTADGHGQDGHIYDPKSGKTYSGAITRTGDRLRLRGYIGLSVFGRTETWTRAPAEVVPCH